MKRVCFIIFGVLVFLIAQPTKAAPINENPSSTFQVTASPTVEASASIQDQPVQTPSPVTATPTTTTVQTESVSSTLNPSPYATSAAVVASPTETEVSTNNSDKMATLGPEILAYNTDNKVINNLVGLLILSSFSAIAGGIVLIKRLKSWGG